MDSYCLILGTLCYRLIVASSLAEWP